MQDVTRARNLRGNRIDMQGTRFLRQAVACQPNGVATISGARQRRWKEVGDRVSAPRRGAAGVRRRRRRLRRRARLQFGSLYRIVLRGPVGRRRLRAAQHPLVAGRERLCDDRFTCLGVVCRRKLRRSGAGVEGAARLGQDAGLHGRGRDAGRHDRLRGSHRAARADGGRKPRRRGPVGYLLHRRHDVAPQRA